MFKFVQLSSLEKVFLDYKPPKKEFESISVLKNERFSYQIAYSFDGVEEGRERKQDFKIKVNSKLKKFIKIRQVVNVPSELTHYNNLCDDDYIKKAPGLFPDPLFELKDMQIKAVSDFFYSIWITVDTKGEALPGDYDIEIIFEAENLKFSKTLKVKIIDASLPEQKLIFTQWFHSDCIASVYNVKVFSQKHWQLIEKFVKTAVNNGINAILTPIFTPPLDTEVGGERPTVQLIDVKIDSGKYSFDFSKLRKWIRLLKDCGVKYFEISHLFTQWGAKAAPKIVAEVDGKKKRIFGWDTPAQSEKYKEFLDMVLPQLVNVLKEEKVDKNCFFHISDEPHGDEMLKSYMAAKAMVEKHLEGFVIMDALSAFEFYKSGAVTHPIPSVNNIKPFLDAGVEDLWTYYCCGQAKDVCNRFFDMPSYRNRAIALQLYKYDIKGFLQWGYNFYYSQYSKEVINPFMTTDAKNSFPSGDSFSVYPGKDGPIESLRLDVFYNALQDIRAMELLQSYIGKDEVVKIIEDTAKINIEFDSYPKSAQTLLKIREKINKRIEEAVK